MAYGARLLSGLRAKPSRGFKSRHLRVRVPSDTRTDDSPGPYRRGVRARRGQSSSATKGRAPCRSPSGESTQPLHPDRHALAVGHQRHGRVAPGLGAHRDRVGRAAGRAGGEAVPDLAVLALDPLADRRRRGGARPRRGRCSRAREPSRPRLASCTSSVDTRSPSSSAAQAASASRSPTSSKERPDSSRQLPSPQERGSATPSSRMPPAASTTSPSITVKPRSAACPGDEAAVVVVAGDQVALVEAVERLVQRLQAEGLPRRAGRGVVAGVEQDRGAPDVGDGARHRVHADVVVAVGDEDRDRLALLGSADSSATEARSSTAPPVERQTLCGSSSSADSTSRRVPLAEQAGVDLERPRRPVGRAIPAGRAGAIGNHSLGRGRRALPGADQAGGRDGRARAVTAVPVRAARRRVATSSRRRRGPSSSHSPSGTSPASAPTRAASDAISVTRSLDLGDLALRLGGDEGVALAELVVRREGRPPSSTSTPTGPGVG